jgi:hypothetical protein
MEFVADLYPDSGLLPSDPVGRAKARFFVDVVNTQFAKPYVAHLHGEGPTMASVLPGLEAIQALLPADRPLALGSAFTMADAAVAPFLLHLEAVLKVRDTEEVGAALRSEKFARLAKYRETLREHPSVQSAWDKVCPPFLLLGRTIANIHLLGIHSAVCGQSSGLALVEGLGEGAGRNSLCGHFNHLIRSLLTETTTGPDSDHEPGFSPDSLHAPMWMKVAQRSGGAPLLRSSLTAWSSAYAIVSTSITSDSNTFS